MDNDERKVASPTYAGFQIARALVTTEEHADEATRERARQKATKWREVFLQMLAGDLDVGSRTPIPDVPTWATLEVLTGGFATGKLLAGGPPTPSELELLEATGQPATDDARLRLNGYFLSEAGLAELQGRLASGSYEIDVPEEGALLVVAWLASHGQAEIARDLLDELGPFFDRLRFYPRFASRAPASAERVFLRSAGEARREIAAMEPGQQVLKQKETIEIWLPLYDRFVAHFLDTVEGDPPTARRDPATGGFVRDKNGSFTVDGGWPCQVYPEGWTKTAYELLGEYRALRPRHAASRKPDDPRDSLHQLQGFLASAAVDPESLSGRDVGRVRLILGRYVSTRGVPGSEGQVAARASQRMQSRAPMFDDLARVIATRLDACDPQDGIDDADALARPVDDAEEIPGKVPAGTPIPVHFRRKLERSSAATVDILVERGVISSGDVLATVLPRLTSDIQAAAITDPSLRRLYSAIYRAFRRRRSLLLLNLESQVRIEELPWVAAIDRYRASRLGDRELASQTLETLALMTFASFPQAIIPNKLLQEFRALAKTAEARLPLVDELAVDIFMGRFSPKFVRAARIAGQLLEGTLYERYYDIDYAALRPAQGPLSVLGRMFREDEGDAFARICSERAGVEPGYDTAANGMIIEQQQILTTQNLAVLFARLSLSERLDLPDLARRCFEWICRRQQMKVDSGHGQLIMLKQTAYAWRQMIFYLALSPAGADADLMSFARRHLAEQPAGFRIRFQPALDGLAHALGETAPPGRTFLGWTRERHWLLADHDREKLLEGGSNVPEPPSIDEVERVFVDVLGGDLTRSDADRWAWQWVAADVAPEMDDAIWAALLHLAGCDIRHWYPDGPYLHSDERVREWLEAFRAATAADRG